MPHISSRYWFPAKTYGWGWGLPNSWQGWLVLLLYLASIFSVSIVISPRLHQMLFFLSLLVLTAGLGVICWLKGEPLRWRWGRK